ISNVDEIEDYTQHRKNEWPVFDGNMKQGVLSPEQRFSLNISAGGIIAFTRRKPVDETCSDQKADKLGPSLLLVIRVVMKEEPGQQLGNDETSKRDDRYQNSAPAPDDHMITKFSVRLRPGLGSGDSLRN